MPKFVLMLPHAPDRYENLSEADFMEVMTDYIGWVEQMSAEGKYLSGEKLNADPGRIVTNKTGSIEVHDGPFTEVAEILGGYMVIEAKDYDDAVEIARAHPHMKHNQTIIIRQTDPAADD
jgi:hypothetical protein